MSYLDFALGVILGFVIATIATWAFVGIWWQPMLIPIVFGVAWIISGSVFYHRKRMVKHGKNVIG